MWICHEDIMGISSPLGIRSLKKILWRYRLIQNATTVVLKPMLCSPIEIWPGLFPGKTAIPWWTPYLDAKWRLIHKKTHQSIRVSIFWECDVPRSWSIPKNLFHNEHIFHVRLMTHHQFSTLIGTSKDCCPLHDVPFQKNRGTEEPDKSLAPTSRAQFQLKGGSIWPHFRVAHNWLELSPLLPITPGPLELRTKMGRKTSAG